MDGLTYNGSGSWTCDADKYADMERLIERAKTGDVAAQREAAALAAKEMHTGATLPPPLNEYITGALWRFGNENCSLNRAFTPQGRQPPEIIKARKQAQEMAIFQWVSLAKDSGLTTSKDGDAGPAFEYVAKLFGLSAPTVRDRYYSVKRRLKKWL